MGCGLWPGLDSGNKGSQGQKFFDPQKVQKRASKVAHNWPKIDSPYHEISGPDICSLICGFKICINDKVVVKASKQAGYNM